ncbi:hypothetical protein BOX15_Mlig026491g1, partial [Macrostomum lignano]
SSSASKQAVSQAEFLPVVHRVFAPWTAVRLLVEHQAGGPDTQAKVDWMQQAVCHWMLENSALAPDELAEVLEQYIDELFSSVFDDGSCYEVARLLCDLLERLRRGETAFVEAALTRLARGVSLQACVSAPSSQQDDDDADDGDGGGDDSGDEQDYGGVHA